jgi:hypothetical protein
MFSQQCRNLHVISLRRIKLQGEASGPAPIMLVFVTCGLHFIAAKGYQFKS